MGGFAVDPPKLAGDGKNLATKADALAAAVRALESALSSSEQMCGGDPAGRTFAMTYRQAGQALFSAAEAAVNACHNVAYGIGVTASNYSHSEAAATVGGATPSVSPPEDPAKFSGPTMPDPFGPPVAEPTAWSLVRQFVGLPWPNGNPATLRAAASAWRAFDSAVAGVAEAVASCSSDLAGGHDIVELAKITEAVNQLSSGVQSLGNQCQSIASSLDSFAGEIESSQNAIRDLLHQLTPSGILGELASVFYGDNPLDKIKEIANDIKEILHTLKREADGIPALFQSLMNELDSLTDALEVWTRKEFTHFLGEDVGNVVANLVNAQLDLDEGAVKSVVGVAGALDYLVTHPQDVPKVVAEINPLGQAVMFARDPEGTREKNINMAKEMVDAKDWTGDHPLRGVGYTAGSIAQFAIPGAGAAKGGAAAGRAAEEAGQAARAEGQAARAGEGILGAGAGPDIAAQGSKIGHDLNLIDVKPAEAPAAPAMKPPEPVAPVRPVDPGPVKTPATGASDGAGASRAPVEAGPAPRASEGAAPGGGVRDAAPMPAAEHAPGAAGPSGGVHEPAPVTPAPHPAASPAGPSEHVPPAGGHAPPAGGHVPEAPSPRMPATSDGVPAETALAGSHSPQAAPTIPHEPVPEAHPGGGHPRESPPHGPYGPGGGDHGGGGGDFGGSGDGIGGGGDHGGHHGFDSPGGEQQGPVHTHEQSGDGWDRLSDAPRDPHYGEPLSEYWGYEHDPADPSRIHPDIRDLMKDPDAPFGRDPQGNAYTQHQYEERFNKVGPEGQPWYNFASDDGALSGSKVGFNDFEQYKNYYGSQLDRIGDDKGSYLAVMEDGRSAFWEQRAMHVDSLGKPLNAYTIDHLPEGWMIEVSQIESAVGQPGGAMQVRILDEAGDVIPVDTLRRMGILR